MADSEDQNLTAKKCLQKFLNAFKKAFDQTKQNSEYVHSKDVSNIEVNLTALEKSLAGNSCPTLDKVSIQLDDYKKLVMDLLDENPPADLGRKRKL